MFCLTLHGVLLYNSNQMGRPKKYEDGTVTIGVRVPIVLHSRLKAASERDGVSEWVVQAIREKLDGVLPNKNFELRSAPTQATLIPATPQPIPMDPWRTRCYDDFFDETTRRASGAASQKYRDAEGKINWEKMYLAMKRDRANRAAQRRRTVSRPGLTSWIGFWRMSVQTATSLAS